MAASSTSIRSTLPNPVGLISIKEKAQPLLAEGIEQMVKLQERLYADHRWALLIILQGMDTSGKDGVIKHVMSGVNPLGCTAHSFRAPTQQELDHDFLWRSQAPAAAPWPYRHLQTVPITKRCWWCACARINSLPRTCPQNWSPRTSGGNGSRRSTRTKTYLSQNGIVPLKFMLHISKDEQRKRLLARADDPEKQWKFSAGDVADRQLWDQYQNAYEDMVRNTATEAAPWYVVPADHKWFARLLVVSAIIDALNELHLKLPQLTPQARADMEKGAAAIAGRTLSRAGICLKFSRIGVNICSCLDPLPGRRVWIKS
jgi:polyphosphate kinase 2 (PPK2 family)